MGLTCQEKGRSVALGILSPISLSPGEPSPAPRCPSAFATERRHGALFPAGRSDVLWWVAPQGICVWSKERYAGWLLGPEGRSQVRNPSGYVRTSLI
jgi:hypothetical protein